MNRILMPLSIIGLTLAVNTASAGEVDINVTLGHASAYADTPYYYPQQHYQQSYYPQPHYTPVYQPVYQAEVHHQPVHPPAHVIVSPHNEYRGSRAYGGGGHLSRGRGH